MADSTATAVSTFHDAITAFRKACGDDKDCEKILVLADATEREIEIAYPDEEKREKPSDPDEPDDSDDEQPTSLKAATAKAREAFAEQRKKSAA